MLQLQSLQNKLLQTQWERKDFIMPVDSMSPEHREATAEMAHFCSMMFGPQGQRSEVRRVSRQVGVRIIRQLMCSHVWCPSRQSLKSRTATGRNSLSIWLESSGKSDFLPGDLRPPMWVFQYTRQKSSLFMAYSWKSRRLIHCILLVTSKSQFCLDSRGG